VAVVQVKFVWKGDQAQARILAGVDGGLRRTGEILIAEARRLILDTPKTGRMYGSHQASAPGEAPASETGALVSGLSVVFRGNQYSRTVVLSSNDPKSSWLEFGTGRVAPRPFMTPTIINTADRVYVAIGGNIRTATSYVPGGE
jgi:hypothetical protein